jgi:hypothetical protein
MYALLENITLILISKSKKLDRCLWGVDSDISHHLFHGYLMLVAASVCLPIVIVLAATRAFVHLHIL